MANEIDLSAFDEPVKNELDLSAFDEPVKKKESTTPTGGEDLGIGFLPAGVAAPTTSEEVSPFAIEGARPKPKQEFSILSGQIQDNAPLAEQQEILKGTGNYFKNILPAIENQRQVKTDLRGHVDAYEGVKTQISNIDHQLATTQDPAIANDLLAQKEDLKKQSTFLSNKIVDLQEANKQSAKDIDSIGAQWGLGAVPKLHKDTSYSEGALKSFNEGYIELIQGLEGAEKFVTDLTGINFNPAGTQTQSEYLKKANAALAEMPEGYAGDVLKGISAMAPALAVTAVFPETRLGTIAEATGGTITKIPAFTTQLAATKFFQKYGESGDTREAMKAGAEGALEGTVMHMLGYGGHKVGEVVEKVTKNELLSGTAGATATGLLFGANDLVNDVANQYLNTGKVEGVDWHKALVSTGTGVAFGLPGIAKAAYARAVNNFNTAPTNVINGIIDSPKTTEELRNEALNKIQEAAELPHGPEKQKAQLAATALSNAADIKAIGDVVVEDPQAFIEEIKNDANLTDDEKQFYEDKINQVVTDNDPRVKASAPFLNDISNLQNKINEIEASGIDPNLKDIQKASLEEQIKGLKKKAIEAYNAEDVKIKEAEDKASTEKKALPEKAFEAVSNTELESSRDIKELYDLQNQIPEDSQEIVSKINDANELRKQSSEKSEEAKRETDEEKVRALTFEAQQLSNQAQVLEKEIKQSRDGVIEANPVKKAIKAAKIAGQQLLTKLKLAAKSNEWKPSMPISKEEFTKFEDAVKRLSVKDSGEVTSNQEVIPDILAIQEIVAKNEKAIEAKTEPALTEEITTPKAEETEAKKADIERIEIPRYFTFNELGGGKGKSGKALSSIEADKNDEIAENFKKQLQEGDKLIEPNGTVTYFRNGKIVKADGSMYGMVDIPAFINGVTIERSKTLVSDVKTKKAAAETTTDRTELEKDLEELRTELGVEPMGVAKPEVKVETAIEAKPKEELPELSRPEVVNQMRPITDQMAKVEMEFSNRGYEIDWDYDNEIQIKDKKTGEAIDVEDLPNELLPLAGKYEDATSRLGDYDQGAYQEALDNSRKALQGEEVPYEEVKPEGLPAKTEEVKSEETATPKTETVIEQPELSPEREAKNEILNLMDRYNRLSRKDRPVVGNNLRAKIEKMAKDAGLQVAFAGKKGNMILVTEKGKRVNKFTGRRTAEAVKEAKEQKNEARKVFTQSPIDLRTWVLQFILSNKRGISIDDLKHRTGLGRNDFAKFISSKNGKTFHELYYDILGDAEDGNLLFAFDLDDHEFANRVGDILTEYSSRRQMRDDLDRLMLGYHGKDIDFYHSQGFKTKEEYDSYMEALKEGAEQNGMTIDEFREYEYVMANDYVNQLTDEQVEQHLKELDEKYPKTPEEVRQFYGINEAEAQSEIDSAKRSVEQTAKPTVEEGLKVTEPTEAEVVKTPILRRLNRAFLNIGSVIFDNAKQLKEKAEELAKGKGKIEYNITMPDGSKKTVVNAYGDVVDGFYSPLEKVIGGAKQEKMPAKQWIDKFANTEEAKWTGLKDWLSNQEGSVSKQDILDYLKNNRIQIAEVVKGGYYNRNLVKQKVEPFVFNVVDEKTGKIVLEEVSESRAEEFIDNAHEGTDTKFSQYQLEGDKENYKEVLVTLPSDKKSVFLKTGGTIEFEKNQFGGAYVVRRNGKELYRTLTESDAINKLPKPTETETKFGADFKSSHFEEPNILVHLRMNTRTDANGNKVLFLEEVQSDWGQQGKKEGFALTEKEAGKAWGEADKKYANFIERMKNKYGEDWENELTKDEVNEEGKLLDERENTKGGIIPQSPFVTDTNAWVKLGLKTALKEAVAQKVDKIAWTTGKQQNERYDLSKTIEQVAVIGKNENDGKSKRVTLIPRDGETINMNVSDEGVVLTGDYKNNRLEDVVGKELSEKILKSDDNQKTRFEGNDLKVGGKGMKGFYGEPSEGNEGSEANQNVTKLYNASPKSFDQLGEGTGLIFLATNKREATAYAEMNRGVVRDIYIDKNKIATEDLLIDELKKEGVNIENGLVYEMIDKRFDDFYIGKDKLNKVFSNLKKQGFKAIEYTDGTQVIGGETKSVVVFDKSAISERPIQVAKTKEGNIGILGGVAKALVKQLTGKAAEIGETMLNTASLMNFEVVKTTKDIKRFSKSGNYTFYENGSPINKNRAYELIEKGEQVEARINGASTQHSIEITPELKASVEGGLPLFHYNKAGEIIGFTHGGKIYLNGEKITAKTTMEEAGHIWTNWAKENRPDLHKSGLEKVDGSAYLRNVENSSFYQKEALKQGKKGSKEYNDYMKEEALAKAIADQGAKFVTEAKKTDFKKWVMNMWKSVASHFGIKNISAEEISKMSLEDFAKKAAADVFARGEKGGAKGAESEMRFKAEQELTPEQESKLKAFVDKKIASGKDLPYIKQMLEEFGLGKEKVDEIMGGAKPTEKIAEVKVEEIAPQKETIDKFSELTNFDKELESASTPSKRNQISSKKQEWLDNNPSMKEIDANAKEIINQLEEKGLITKKEGPCF